MSMDATHFSNQKDKEYYNYEIYGQKRKKAIGPLLNFFLFL